MPKRVRERLESSEDEEDERSCKAKLSPSWNEKVLACVYPYLLAQPSDSEVIFKVKALIELLCHFDEPQQSMTVLHASRSSSSESIKQLAECDRMKKMVLLPPEEEDGKNRSGARRVRERLEEMVWHEFCDGVWPHCTSSIKASLLWSINYLEKRPLPGWMCGEKILWSVKYIHDLAGLPQDKSSKTTTNIVCSMLQCPGCDLRATCTAAREPLLGLLNDMAAHKQEQWDIVVGSKFAWGVLKSGDQSGADRTVSFPNLRFIHHHRASDADSPVVDLSTLGAAVLFRCRNVFTRRRQKLRTYCKPPPPYEVCLPDGTQKRTMALYGNENEPDNRSGGRVYGERGERYADNTYGEHDDAAAYDDGGPDNVYNSKITQGHDDVSYTLPPHAFISGEDAGHGLHLTAGQNNNHSTNSGFAPETRTQDQGQDAVGGEWGERYNDNAYEQHDDAVAYGGGGPAISQYNTTITQVNDDVSCTLPTHACNNNGLAPKEEGIHNNAFAPGWRAQDQGHQYNVDGDWAQYNDNAYGEHDAVRDTTVTQGHDDNCTLPTHAFNSGKEGQGHQYNVDDDSENGVDPNISSRRKMSPREQHDHRRENNNSNNTNNHGQFDASDAMSCVSTMADTMCSFSSPTTYHYNPPHPRHHHDDKYK